MSNYSPDPPSATRVWKHRISEQVWLAILLVAATVASWSQSSPPIIETTAPDLDAFLQSVERVQQQNPAQSRPYEVTRKYKVFRADDKQPMSEVTAQISFTPPDMKTYKITHASGNTRGEKIVRAVLDQETASAKKRDNNQINRGNYDFVFLRRENFGVVPEYVLLIIPKRKAKNLLLGQIWVDANTFRIRRIEGVAVKSPSIWIKDIHITLQFALLNGMWVPVSFDAVATVRFLGQYTLTGLNAGAADRSSTAP
jgi:hypothetical protein